MSVSAIEPSQFGNTETVTRAPKQAMDSEVFLHLLVTQLANQDPSSPMDSNQMISQATELASMERMNTLAATQQSALDIQARQAAAALIGQEITTGSEPPVSGVVDSVSFNEDGPVLRVGEQLIPYAQVIKVNAAPGVEQPVAPEPEGTPGESQDD